MHYTIRCVILYHALNYTMHYTIPRTILATNLKLLQSAPTKSYREASNSSTSLITARGPVAQWIRHWPTEPGIAGSSPAGVMSMLLVQLTYCCSTEITPATHLGFLHKDCRGWRSLAANSQKNANLTACLSWPWGVCKLIQPSINAPLAPWPNG